MFTAMDGYDYIQVFSDLVFTSGSMDNAIRCANISILDDGALEADEIFTVVLNTSDLSVTLVNMTAITLMDNDGTQLIV